MRVSSFSLVTMAVSQRDHNFTWSATPFVRGCVRADTNDSGQQVNGNFKCTRRRNVHRLLSAFVWPVVNVAVYLLWRTLMATTATKVFPFALQKQMLPDSQCSARNSGSRKTAEKKFPAGCIGLIKTSGENAVTLAVVLCKWVVEAMAGQRYVVRNLRDIGIHSEFNIENMKLFRGWLADGCALTMKFQREECTRARM